jgi:hypothetical protein
VCGDYALRSILSLWGLSSRSRDIVVGVETGYGLFDRGVAVRAPVVSRIFFFVQTGCGVHTIGTGGSFPGGKAAGA